MVRHLESPNISDVYEEKLNPAIPLEYLYEGTWRPIHVDYETFRVKGPKGWNPSRCRSTTPTTGRS